MAPGPRSLGVAGLALLAVGCHTPVPPRPAPQPPSPTVDAASEALPDASDPSPPDAGPSALERVRAETPSREPLSAEEAAWWPSRVLPRVAEHWGALPTPGAPRTEAGTTVWPLLAASTVPAGASAALCAALATAEPRGVCAFDQELWRGALRDRVVLGWRGVEGPVLMSAVQPLRALARSTGGLCLVQVQRTEATLDMTVRAGDPAVLGAALAALVVSPGLASLLVVRVEPRGDGLEALLSWPTRGRAGSRGAMTLGDDPWPTRCDGQNRVAEGTPRGTLPVPLLPIDGASARGAFVRVGRPVWAVTVGDEVAGWTVRAITPRGLAVQARGQPRPRVIAFAPP